ncbi:MAG: S8/S53 family peptidase, partial [Nevskiaceae bacterium]
MKSNLVRWATFASSLVLASATASAAGVFVGQSGPQPSGWQSPGEGGNGDYVFIDTPTAGTTVEGSATISGRAGNSSTDPDGNGGGGGDNTFAQQPQVVIAMIDTGGNPYHVDFRDETRLVHPSTYLTGFPASAKAVPLCFVDSSNGAFAYRDDCSTSWRTNVTSDEPVTGSVAVDDLVWYPGTRLMGKSFAHEDASTPVGFDEGGDSSTSHGSWVSSNAVGKKFGTCPDCMLIILEGDTVEAIDAAYLWAAQQPWIDVITSSITVGLIGAGVNPGIFPGKHAGAVAASENGKIFLTSSGNGAANFGLVPTSTYLYDGGSPAVIPVGAASADGFASHWSDFPAEIMANGNSRQVADTASMSGQTSVGGTSFSSPGAAGTLAHALLEARRACNDFEEGASPSGSALTLLRNGGGCAVASGPFADGTLTRDELHEAFVKNAIPPYTQLSPIPGPVTWAKNAYGYVDLGHGINNGGSTIQPLVTDSILGTRAIPVRALEQFWYDDVVREGQARQWGPRPVADGDDDAFPRDDGACMPDCAPAELQRYAEGFAGLGNDSTYQDLFDVLGVSAEAFAQAAPTGFGGTYEPMPNVAGVIAETGDLTVSNDASVLAVRLNLAGLLDGSTPAVLSNPVSYEVTFSANHNGVAQAYRLSYEFEAVDLLALLDGTISEPLTDKFEVFVETTANAQGISSICPIEADLSGSHFDIDANDAVWVVPLTAFSQDNRAAQGDCAGFTNGGRALGDGDTITDLAASAVLTVGIVNFGNGLGLFGESTADDYTLGGGGTQSATVAVTVNGQPAGTATPVNGQWSLDIDFSQHAPVNG